MVAALGDVFAGVGAGIARAFADIAVALAHSLSSSATVGFTTLSWRGCLSMLCKHVQLQSGGTAEQAEVFMASADDIRRLLHQFAAGFLKEPSAEVLQQLREILETEVVNTLSPPEDDFDEFGDFAEAPEAEQTAEIEPEPVPAEAPTVQAAEVVAAGYVAPALSIVGSDRDQNIDDAIAHAVSAGSDVDDDIDAIDVIDPDLFPIFEEEAAELLPQLGGALRQWASRPDNLGARNEVLRALHTLKGSSRLAGAMRLGEMSHRLESAIEQLDMETVTADQIEPLLASFDGLQANFEFLRVVGGQEPADAVAAVPAAPGDLADATKVSGAAASSAVRTSHQRFGFPGLRSWRLCVWPRTSRCACVRSCWTVW
jgi:chemosensory pili system protein ChpA (sensor histidine kinase/response regulator)